MEILEMTTVPIKTNEQQTILWRVKDTDVPNVQTHNGEANGTPNKRKEISPLQSEGWKKRKIKSRKEKPEQKAPRDSEMEMNPPKEDHETRVPTWQNLESRRTKNEKENKKKEKEDGRSRLRT